MAPPSTSDRIPLLVPASVASSSSERGEEEEAASSRRWYRRTASLVAGALAGLVVVGAVLNASGDAGGVGGVGVGMRGGGGGGGAGELNRASLGLEQQQQQRRNNVQRSDAVPAAAAAAAANNGGAAKGVTAAAAATTITPVAATTTAPVTTIATPVAKTTTEAAESSDTCRPVRDFSESPCAKVFSQRDAASVPQDLVETFSACTHGLDDFPKSQPYAIGGGKKQAAAATATTENKKKGPFVYSFVHIPKTGGSTVAVRFNFLARQSGGCVREENEPDRYAASYPVDPHHPMYPARCVIDASTGAFVHTADALSFHRAPEFTKALMANAHEQDRRAWIKGMFAMGTCDLVDAPCAYVTVLRDPVDRLLSHYKYICLQGAEDREGWLPEWRAAGSCPMDPYEFWTAGGATRWGEFNKQGHPEQMVAYLAPGADPTGECALETAKKNLEAPCMRYLLMEYLSHGMHELMEGNYDMKPRESDLGQGAYTAAMPYDLAADRAHVNAAEPLPKDLKRRYDGYVKDEALMAKLRSLVPRSTALYEHAKKGYHAQWEKPLETC